jgi:DNA-binding transcriptional LysR family regulator
MARRVLSSLDEALDNLTNLKELRRGLVRVAAPETLSCTLLPELIAGYNNSHPGVDVRFDDVPIQEVLAGLQNGSTDIGFGPAGVVPDQSVEVHMICADPLLWRCAAMIHWQKASRSAGRICASGRCSTTCPTSPSTC